MNNITQSLAGPVSLPIRLFHFNRAIWSCVSSLASCRSFHIDTTSLNGSYQSKELTIQIAQLHDLLGLSRVFSTVRRHGVISEDD